MSRNPHRQVRKEISILHQLQTKIKVTVLYILTTVLYFSYSTLDVYGIILGSYQVLLWSSNTQTKKLWNLPFPCCVQAHENIIIKRQLGAVKIIIWLVKILVLSGLWCINAKSEFKVILYYTYYLSAVKQFYVLELMQLCL